MMNPKLKKWDIVDTIYALKNYSYVEKVIQKIKLS